MNALQNWNENYRSNNEGHKSGGAGYVPPPFFYYLIEHYTLLGQNKVANDRAAKLIEMLQKIDNETLQSLIYHQSDQRKQIKWDKKREDIIAGLGQYRKVKEGRVWRIYNGFVSAFIVASTIAYQLRVGKIERYMPKDVDQDNAYFVPPYELTTYTSFAGSWKLWINWFMIQPPSFEFEKHPKEKEKWLEFEKELPAYSSEVLSFVRENKVSLAMNEIIRESGLIK